MKSPDAYIYGKHAVMEAVKNKPEAVLRVFFAPGFEDQSLKDKIRAGGIKLDTLDSRTLPKDLDQDAATQGVVARVDPTKLMVAYETFIKDRSIDADTAIAVLGEIQDPHNVGAIIRSAAGFGIAAVIIPEHNRAPITGTVVKVSAGMAFRVPLIEVGNINNTLSDLKERGFWTYGLSETGDHPIDKEKFDAPAVFVFGNEAKGIREKTLEACDIALSIPIHARCESLNVAAAAAVCFQNWSAQHPRALIDS